MLKLKSKSKSSPPPKFSGVATESDWTDADWGFQDGNHGTVTPRKSASPKVQSPSTRRHESESEPDFSQSDGWGDDWDANESAAPSEVTFTEKETQKLKSKTTKLPSKQKEKPGQGGKTGKPQELGSEYDIMTIKVKPAEEKSDPFDFFSDMEPVIKAKNPLAELAERSKTEGNASTTDKDKAQTTTSSKLSFAVIDTDDVSILPRWAPPSGFVLYNFHLLYHDFFWGYYFKHHVRRNCCLNFKIIFLLVTYQIALYFLDTRQIEFQMEWFPSNRHFDWLNQDAPGSRSPKERDSFF